MKFRTHTFFSILLFLPFYSAAQINDCSEALVVCSSENLGFNPQGPGQDDFADPDNDPGCITVLEQNSAWYYFEINPLAPPNLVLGFIINPNGGLGEDYDWALYGPNVDCGNLGSPIRCSSSSAACGFCPETGMGMGTTDVTEGPGSGDGFVMTLIVQPGQGFYLLIDNWLGTPNGFVLTWTDSAAPFLDCTATPPCALGAVAGTDIDACDGDTSIPLNGESTGNHGNEMYSWSGDNGGTAFLSDPESQNPTVNLPMGFTGSIIYTLTVTEDTCVGIDQVELTVHPLPTVIITQIDPLCENDLPQALSAFPTGGVWGGAATGNTFNPMTNGPGIHTVTYTYTDGNDCSTTQTSDIEVYEIPTISIDPDPAEFCDNENSILITASGSGGAGGYEYVWTTPSGMDDGNTYTATLSGTHSVIVTDDNGCTNTSSVIVTAYANPDVEIVDPGPICVGDAVVTIMAVPPGGEFDGNIIDPSGEVFPNMNVPGTYQINYTYYDNNNCEGTDNLTITIIPIPEIVATNNGPLCQGQPILLFGETTGTGSVITYNWSGPNGYSSNQQNPTDATVGGNYILEVSIDGCPSQPTVTTVLQGNTPDAIAQNTGPYCNGETIQLLGSTSSTGTMITYAWSGPNGYTSNQQNPIDATAAGMYSLLVTADGCVSTVSQTNVIFSTPPNATATNSGPYCQGEPIALFGNTTTPGTNIIYTWSGPGGYTSSVQNPTDASATGMYQLVIEVDGCQSANTTTSVIVNPLPQPVITGQDSFCIGNTATIDAGSGYASYEWNDASQNQTLVVTSSGTYQVTVTDVNDCVNNASIYVTEIPSLTPVITGSLDFCEGSSTVLDAGAGYTSYVWSTGEMSQSITVTVESNIGVIVTDADGCSGSTNITTVINPNPNVIIGGSTTFCIGGFTTLDAGTGYASYQWSNDSTTQNITVSSPGVYTVDVVDIFGCVGNATVTIEESTSLSPVITGNLAFCENGTTTLNAGSGFATYLWSDGSAAQYLIVDSAGMYAVSVSDGQGCFGDTSASIIEVFPPSAVLQTSDELCNTIAGGSVINLFDLVLSGDTNGSWKDVDNSGAVGLFNNLDFNNVPAGDYQFTYTTNSAIIPCPETEYQVVITVLDCTCPDVFFYTADPLCNSGDVLDVSTIENTTETGNWSILQVPSGGNPATLNGNLFDANAADPGQYILQFTLQNQPPPGCPLDFQVSVNVDEQVIAGIAAPPVSYCSNENEVINLSSLISGADPNGIWRETSPSSSTGAAFNPVNATFSTINQDPGIYIFEYALTSNGACPGDATEVTVEINPLPTAVVVDNVTLDCNNPIQSLNATGSSFGPSFDLQWTGPGIIANGNESTLQPTIDQQGNYILTIINLTTGCTNTASVTVNANTDPPTDALILSQDPSCFGDQNGMINIDQVIGGTFPYLFSFNNGPFTNIDLYNNLTGGNYSIVVEDVNGCRWDTAIVLVEPTDFDINIGPDIELGLGESATVQALINLSLNQIDTLIWSPDQVIECIDLGCLEATVQSFNSVTLTATVYDVNGCRDTDELIISVNKNRKVFIPTIFSPNNDGINDRFFVFGDEGQIVKIKNFVVFNRWGEQLHAVKDFFPNDPDSGWDGYFNDQLMNPGVFVYIAEIEFIDNVVKLYSGDVTLTR